MRPLDISPGSGIDLDTVPFIDEQRDRDRSSGINGGRFVSRTRRIALNAGIAVFDLGNNKGRQNDLQNVIFVTDTAHLEIFLKEPRVIFSDDGLGDKDLFISGIVKEMIKISALIKILQPSFLQRNIFDPFGTAEGSF